MKFNSAELAKMIDLSAVRADASDESILELVNTAKKYQPHLITTLPAFTAYARKLLGEKQEIGLSGNIGFPSGGQTTLSKAEEARELLSLGCTELDMVINIGKLISGWDQEVQDDIRAVVDTAGRTPVSVTLECYYLSDDQMRKGCELIVKAGAAFVKTGTGWTPTGATVENVALIKAVVGDAVQIKSSGGIRSLQTIVDLYQQGACRFGVGLRWLSGILDACDTIQI